MFAKVKNLLSGKRIAAPKDLGALSLEALCERLEAAGDPYQGEAAKRLRAALDSIRKLAINVIETSSKGIALAAEIAALRMQAEQKNATVPAVEPIIGEVN